MCCHPHNKSLQVLRCLNSHRVVFEFLENENLYRFITGIKEPDKVQILDLSHQGLTEIPVEIGQLINLTELRLWNNVASTIPPEIFQLTNLTILGLAGNQISVIPSELWQLTSLT